jgi:hypothetical protein
VGTRSAEEREGGVEGGGGDYLEAGEDLVYCEGGKKKGKLVRREKKVEKRYEDAP